MNAVEEYGLTLKIEVLKEYGAHLLAVIYRYQEFNSLDSTDESDMVLLMEKELEDIIHNKLYMVTTMKELERYILYLDRVSHLLENCEINGVSR